MIQELTAPDFDAEEGKKEIGRVFTAFIIVSNEPVHGLWIKQTAAIETFLCQEIREIVMEIAPHPASEWSPKPGFGP